MRSLFRNRYLRKFAEFGVGNDGHRAWPFWLVFFLLQLRELLPRPLQILMLVCLFVPLLAFVGLCAVALPHYWVASARETIRRRNSGQRFLCPECLFFDSYQFACGRCGGQVELLPVYTRGLYVDTCPQCRESLFEGHHKPGEAPPKVPEVQAYCQTCRGDSPRRIHHCRRVRVAATLREEDFAKLCQTAGQMERRVRRGPLVSRYPDDGFITFGLKISEEGDHRVRHPVRYACVDDGECLTYILLCDHEGWLEETVPPQHALRHIEAIWLDAENISPLRLGQAIDRFIRHSGLAEAKEPAIKVCVPQTRLDPVVSSRLETLLGRISYGVAAADFLSPGTAAVSTQPALADSSASPETVAAEFASAQWQKEFQEP
ncbi:MAG TPA: hypothetical protein VNQ79_09435 [Blastocatellia bacterium]|nr:hypothetical protein [Blastocatellia bacterium]